MADCKRNVRKTTCVGQERTLAFHFDLCSNQDMTKEEAIIRLGGRIKCAEAIGISPQAVSAWPTGELPSRIADRVEAAIARQPKRGKSAKKDQS
jgi:hypothetical protein